MSFRDEHEALRARLDAAESELKELRPLRIRNRRLKKELKRLKQLLADTNSDNVDAMRKAHDQIAALEIRTQNAHVHSAHSQWKTIFLWVLLTASFTVLYYLVRR